MVNGISCIYSYTYGSIYVYNGKKVKQSHYRPGVAQRIPEVKVPRFHDNDTGWW
jgi:hypothetical protein